MAALQERLALPKQQERLWLNPTQGLDEDIHKIYDQGILQIGWPDGNQRIFAGLARENTVVIVGTMLGDEGKGRIVDNKLEALLSISGIQRAYVIRYQGGQNAGHTVENGNIKLALHGVPSAVMYPQAIGIIDRGTVVHPEDLATEVGYIEDAVGAIRDRLILSEDAILLTDLHRARESLNRLKNSRAEGGTERGISPAYADFYEKKGLFIRDLLADDWRDTLGTKYDECKLLFDANGIDLATVDVLDFKTTHLNRRNAKRPLGTREEFLDRLEESRRWLIESHIVQNTFTIHQKALQDPDHTGIIFEGAQALGLNAWLGTLPDVTASDTSGYGIVSSTGVWRPQDIEDRIGVLKLTYTSSVGKRVMPTDMGLHGVQDLADLPGQPTDDQILGNWIRHAANERGTSTGRWRDPVYLDLPMLAYNARMSGLEVLIGTHLDIARENVPVRVCTHYTDNTGAIVPYQPGLHNLQGLTPHYVDLPGWDGDACQNAKSVDDLPENALKFLAFLQARSGYPIVAVTTGPDRQNLLTFPGYQMQRAA